MTTYLSGPMLAFDTETTGVQVETDRVVTTCTAWLTPATPLWTQDITSQLLAVEIDIPAEAEAVHGISTKFARDNGVPPAEALDIVAADLARAMLAKIPVVGSNLAYDLTILDRELRRHDLPTVDERLGRDLAPVIDILVLDKYLDPYRKGSRKLVDLCRHYGVRIEGAHDSTGDALAAARVAFRIGWLARADAATLRLAAAQNPYPALDRMREREVAGRYRELAGMTLADVHDAQVLWRQEQQESLGEYFRRKGLPFDGDGHWPMRPLTTQGTEAVPHG